MSGKRDRITIMNDILEVIGQRNGNAKPTQIMYKANLSNEMLNEYLKELISRNLLVEKKDKNGRRTYDLTEKGFRFISDFKQMRGFLTSYDLD